MKWIFVVCIILAGAVALVATHISQNHSWLALGLDTISCANLLCALWCLHKIEEREENN